MLWHYNFIRHVDSRFWLKNKIYVNSRLFRVAKTLLSKALRIMWCQCWNEPSNSSMIESLLCLLFKLVMQADGESPVMGTSLPPELFIYLRTALTIRKFFLLKNQTMITLHFHLLAHREQGQSFYHMIIFQMFKKQLLGSSEFSLLWDKHLWFL